MISFIQKKNSFGLNNDYTDQGLTVHEYRTVSQKRVLWPNKSGKHGVLSPLSCIRTWEKNPMVQARWALQKVRFNSSVWDRRHLLCPVEPGIPLDIKPTVRWQPYRSHKETAHSSTPISQRLLKTTCYRSSCTETQSLVPGRGDT